LKAECGDTELVAINGCCCCWLLSLEIDDDDNSTKCDAVLAVAQFHRNFPQFRSADNGARRNYLLSAATADRPGDGGALETVASCVQRRVAMCGMA